MLEAPEPVLFFSERIPIQRKGVSLESIAIARIAECKPAAIRTPIFVGGGLI